MVELKNKCRNQMPPLKKTLSHPIDGKEKSARAREKAHLKEMEGLGLCKSLLRSFCAGTCRIIDNKC